MLGFAVVPNMRALLFPVLNDVNVPPVAVDELPETELDDRPDTFGVALLAMLAPGAVTKMLRGCFSQ